MADVTTPQDKAQNDLLAALGQLYSFVQSRAYTKTLAAYCFDDYIQEALDQIKSDTTGIRPTKLQELDNLETLLDQVAQSLNSNNSNSTPSS